MHANAVLECPRICCTMNKVILLGRWACNESGSSIALSEETDADAECLLAKSLHSTDSKCLRLFFDKLCREKDVGNDIHQPENHEQTRSGSTGAGIYAYRAYSKHLSEL